MSACNNAAGDGRRRRRPATRPRWRCSSPHGALGADVERRPPRTPAAAPVSLRPGAEAHVDRGRARRRTCGSTPRARPRRCSPAARRWPRARREEPLTRAIARGRHQPTRGRHAARVCASSASRAGWRAEDLPERREDAERDLCFLGLRRRCSTRRARRGRRGRPCHTAGIRIIVVTGDHGLTAAAIARRVGIAGERPTVVTGDAARAPCPSASSTRSCATARADLRPRLPRGQAAHRRRAARPDEQSSP